MDLELDRDLFYIAEEGLKASLGDNYVPCKAPDEMVYYYDFSNKKLLTEHPCDMECREIYKNIKANRF